MISIPTHTVSGFLELVDPFCITEYKIERFLLNTPSLCLHLFAHVLQIKIKIYTTLSIVWQLLKTATNTQAHKELHGSSIYAYVAWYHMKLWWAITLQQQRHLKVNNLVQSGTCSKKDNTSSLHKGRIKCVVGVAHSPVAPLWKETLIQNKMHAN